MLPLAVLILYAYLGWEYIAKTEDQEKFADSIYYLGFLFTLVTLALALIYLATSADWERVPLGELIGRFGLALGTTIVGLAIRVAWVNTLMTLHDARLGSEQALVMAANTFRLELQASSEAFQTLNDTYMEEMQKSAAISSKTYQDHADESKKSLDKVLNQVTDAINVSTQTYTTEFEKKMAKFALPDEWIRRAVTQPINEITQTLQSVSAELEKVLETQKSTSVDSKRLAKSYSGIADALQPLAEVSGKVGDIGNKFEQVSGSLDMFMATFDSRVGGTEQRLAALSVAIDKLEKSVGALSTAMTTAGDTSESLARIASVAETHKNELETILTASRQAVDSLHKELLGAAQLVTRKLGDR